MEYTPPPVHVRFLALVEQEPNGQYTAMEFLNRHWPEPRKRLRPISYQRALTTYGYIEQIRTTVDGRPRLFHAITDKGRQLLEENRYLLIDVQDANNVHNNVRALTRSYLQRFVDEKCIIGPFHQTSLQNFYTVFCDWVEQNKDTLEVPSAYYKPSIKMVSDIVRREWETREIISRKRVSEGYVLNGISIVNREVTT